MSHENGELPSSKLGTHEYWESLYAQEIQQQDDQEVGAGWFGESATRRLVNWILKNDHITKSSAIVDVGCGGAEVLIELFDMGFTNLCGTEYSKNAIEVAKLNLKKSGFSEDSLKLVCSDITSESILHSNESPELLSLSCSEDVPEGYAHATFEVCLDKGTYDAISLHPEHAEESRNAYIKNVAGMLEENGFFAIVSCNWTTTELKQHFSHTLEFYEEVKAPVFSFGGATGQTVSTCIFQKQHSCSCL